jgi:hypothetical protein
MLVAGRACRADLLRSDITGWAPPHSRHPFSPVLSNTLPGALRRPAAALAPQRTPLRARRAASAVPPLGTGRLAAAAASPHPRPRRAPAAPPPAASSAAAAAAPGDNPQGDTLTQQAMASTDFTHIKILDSGMVFNWLRQYMPFAQLSPEAVQEIAEVRRLPGPQNAAPGPCCLFMPSAGDDPSMSTPCLHPIIHPRILPTAHTVPAALLTSADGG